jgi:hypothetical protein
MKVKELIEELKKFNPEAECYGYEGLVLEQAMYMCIGCTNDGGDILDTDRVEIF